MAQSKPTLDRKAAEQINLNVLRRLDPQIEELIDTAAHVALYDFDVATTKWSRKEVEGSLFLVKRRGAPRFRFIILNKKSADNYTEDVGGGFQTEVNVPYLLYRNKAGEVVGIWFYDESDCKRLGQVISRISSTFAAPSDNIQGNGSGAVGEVNASNEESGAFWDNKMSQSAPQSGGENALARVFASLKVAPQVPQGVPLLTPQFLQGSNQGARLLESLTSNNRGGTTNSGAQKVAALLRALSNNEVVCAELAKEMAQAGFGL